MSVKRSSEFKRLWLNWIVALQKRLMELKKGYRKITKNIKPFFVPKYWLIYLVSFGLGFYLFGPAHGLQQLKSFKLPALDTNKEINTLDALQRELDDLKRDLQAMKDQEIKKRSVFVPNNFGEPVVGEVVTGFEWIYRDNAWRLHSGLEIEVQPNSNVVAAADGQVSEIKETGQDNFTVKIAHGDGWESVYANLTQPAVKEGQEINKGLPIGTVNQATGEVKPNLYFAIYHQGQPIDPMKYIKTLSRKEVKPE
ncbi:MAG TPA: M23 family metallopeptidase [Bacillota bacterium]|nr:M23 family metallopeptidase [Bacillota bacterium]HOL08917.1 M23 family metallopeptidase [Bacillota bacterium]HPO96610.1 M23 family metallopeptidase [Bacillota bacterium]